MASSTDPFSQMKNSIFRCNYYFYKIANESKMLVNFMPHLNEMKNKQDISTECSDHSLKNTHKIFFQITVVFLYDVTKGSERKTRTQANSTVIVKQANGTTVFVRK